MKTKLQKMKAVFSVLVIGAAIVLQSGRMAAQSYTLSPTPFHTILSTAGAIVPNGCVWTYAAGTTTPIATYADNIGTVNGNPIIADNFGRFVVYLAAGTNYKFQYERTPCNSSTHGVVLKTQDNIAAVPAAAATVDVQGVAGETISAGQCAYLSDGSGAKTQGQWYKCDSTNAYSSTLPEVGIATATITVTNTGTIRLVGAVTGLTTTTGASYYVGSSGALTATAPLQRRFLGVADTTSSIVLKDVPLVQAWVDDFRLTLTTAVPVTSSDVTAAVTIFCTPFLGNRLDLPDAQGNPVRVTSAEFSIAVPATTSQMYDIFAFSNAGVATLELLAWTNDTTRATAIIRTAAGRLYKSGDLTRLYLGSFRTTTVSGQTEDSVTKRFLVNYYNRVRRDVLKTYATGSWTYSTATWRQADAGGGTTNKVEVIQAVAEWPIWIAVTATAANDTGGGINANVGIGEDSTTTPLSVATIGLIFSVTVNQIISATAVLHKIPAVGYHQYVGLEAAQATGIWTWRGGSGTTAGTVASNGSGINGWIEG